MVYVKQLKDMAHIKYLDALRGIAILMVIVVHSAVFSGQSGMFMDLAFIGKRGVQLFYLISAFTLCMSLDYKKANENRPLLNFFIRRFFRIAPLFYTAIIANLFYQGLAPRPEAPVGLSWSEVVSGFFFLNGFIPSAINSIAIGGWSVAVEVCFYSILPFLHVRFDSVKKIAVLLACACPVAFTVSYALAFLFPRQSEYFKFLWFPVEFPIFVMGMLLYRVRKYFIESDFVWGFVFIMLGLWLFFSTLPVYNARLYGSSLGLAIFVLGVSLWQSPVLVNLVTIFIGRISYSLYLTHFFAIMLASRILSSWSAWSGMSGGGRFLAMFLITLIISIGISLITFFGIEKPGIALGRKIVDRLERSVFNNSLAADCLRL
jgi:peptidoglycan/LPS O-acetylase OafA/YrhL